MDLFQGEPDQDLVLEFRAGKMSMQGKMVYADHRKGLVSVSQADDGMIYFAWKDRSTNQVEDVSVQYSASVSTLTYDW